MSRAVAVVIAAFAVSVPTATVLAQANEQQAPEPQRWEVRAGQGAELAPEILARLTPEQLVEVLRERERTEQRRMQRFDPTAITVPLGLFAAIALSIGLVQYYANRRDQLKHRTLQAMVEKGIQIPPELLVKPVRPGSDLRRGLVLVGTGLGIAAFFAVLRVPDILGGLWSIGLIPVLIGAGYLLASYIEARRAGSR